MTISHIFARLLQLLQLFLSKIEFTTLFFFSSCSTITTCAFQKITIFQPKSSKNALFQLFSPKNLQNPKCSSYLCTVFRDRQVFCQNSTWPPMSRPCYGLASGSVKLPKPLSSEFPQNSTPLFLGSSPGLNPGQPYSHYSYYSH